MNKWNLHNKLALITDISGATGQAIASEFALLGARLILVARSETNLTELNKSLSKYQPDITSLVADITQPADRRMIADTVRQLGGKLDILINNVSTVLRQVLPECSDEENQLIFEVGVVLATSELILPFLRLARKATIVNIAAIIGLSETEPDIIYGFSKRALPQLGRNLAANWAHFDIRVNTVSPWYHKTDSVADSRLHAGLITPAVQYEGSSCDIAVAVAFLAMEKAAGITGQTIAIMGSIH